MLCGLATSLALPATSALAQDDELPPWLRDDEESPSAQVREEPADPARLIFGVGGGATLRFTQNLDFDQDRFAPSFLELSGGFVFPGRGVFRHGVGLAVSTNLSGDGPATGGFDALQQWVLVPSYVARIGFGGPVPDYEILARIGPGFTIAPDFSPGLEIAGGFAYMFLAGLGAYAEATFGMWMGGDDNSGSTTVHPLVSVEVGLHIDYELL